VSSVAPDRSVLARVRAANVRGVGERSLVVRLLVLISSLVAANAVLGQGVGGPFLRIGVFVGILAGNGISVWLETPPYMPWDWAAIGLGVCSLVGIIFGVYPAWKASTLDPIESLRYE
jgi:putative ABC transport system permease protein